MIYPRIITKQLENELTTKEIVVLTGIRQVGKTTLLRHLFETVKSSNKAFFDMENIFQRKVFQEENFDTVIQNLQQFGIDQKQYSYIFIDEIQYVKALPRVIKYLYDHYQIKFIVSGSSSYYLKNLFSESLSSRKVVYELFPLTFGEFLLFKNVQRKTVFGDISKKNQSKSSISYELYKPYYEEYVQFGGFPAVVREPSPIRKHKLLDSIISSYFEMDVKTLADFSDITILRNLLILLSRRIGSKLDIQKLASELSVTRSTIYSYLSFFEKTYVISLLSKYTKSIDRSSAGGKKLYFCDTGLANHIGQLSYGQLLENSVFQNLRPLYNLNYFSKPHGSEIDFIVDCAYALEVKQTASKRDILRVKDFSKRNTMKGGFVVSSNFIDLDGVILAQDL